MNQLISLLYQREDLNNQLIRALLQNFQSAEPIWHAVERADEMMEEIAQESATIQENQHVTHIRGKQTTGAPRT